MSDAAPKKRRVDDEDDGLSDDDDDDESSSSDEDIVAPASKKRKKGNFVDDAAVESGEEDNDEDEDDNDEDNNEYVKDGFVVDEDDDQPARKKDDLEDSDDEDDDEDDDDEATRRKKKEQAQKLTRIRKIKENEKLSEEDLALIREARGEVVEPEDMAMEPENDTREHIVARNADELRQGLFYDSDGGDGKGDAAAPPKPTKNVQRPGGDLYDEDGMDDFIEDDIGDQGDIRASERRGMMDEGEGINEAQLAEASEIFGSDYLDFINRDEGQGGDNEEEDELMGRREGIIDYGLEYSDQDDDDDMFDAEDENDAALDGLSAQQKAEALRLKREKRTLAKQERRREAAKKRAEKRKAQLRRVFEPVQLIENFCTDRDDQIRQSDVPERLFGWNTPFYGPEDAAAAMSDELGEKERAQAEWIANRIPAVAMEYTLASTEEEQLKILQSIAFTLRYLHRDKLEPAFIKRYRKDYVTSNAVRENLDRVMDEDSEYDRIVNATKKVEALISSITSEADGDAASGADADRIVELKASVESAKQQLDDSQARLSSLQAELDALNKAEDDDDGGLFEDDDEDEEEKAKEKARVAGSLKDVQELVALRTEKVNNLESELKLAEAQSAALNDKAPMERVMKKTCRNSLWNTKDYLEHLHSQADTKEVVDMNGYFSLIKEGNEAIKKKELPILAASSKADDKRKRSRRFDRDFYRTCVSEGLRTIAYKYLLSPNRVGIKLEELARTGQFDFTRTMPAESEGQNSESIAGPMQWVPPTIPQSPKDFASELIGSGELVLLSNSGGRNENSEDPLRGCRYVAALELASEPRIRKHLRSVYRKHALLTTRPTKKGTEELDAFHDFYGLHLIRNKPTSEHFPLDPIESAARRARLTPAECNEFDSKQKEVQTHSCLQYLNLVKAAQGGFVSVHIHLPLKDHLIHEPKWYDQTGSKDTLNLFQNGNQRIDLLLSELEKVYLPAEGDAEEWNKERRYVLLYALNNFLLPQFEMELQRDLREVASQVGVQAAAANLREMAMEGPYRPDALNGAESRFIVPTEDQCFVSVCVSTDPKEASYLTYVGINGRADDFLAIPGGTRVDQGKMKDKVLMFLMQHRPHAVVIGTSGGFGSRNLYRKMKDLLQEAKELWSKRDIQGDDEDDEAYHARRDELARFERNDGFDDEDEDEEWTCNAELLDDKVAQLFGRSVRGKKEFPDFPVNHRCSIALGRHAQDPLGELTYAWSVASDAGVFGTEMLYLNIHPLQQFLPRTMLLREYERVLCDVVAEIGSDINSTHKFDHLRGLLMFVPGLGPRKAANLKQVIEDSIGFVSRRRDLLEQRLMGPVVYNNAVAFVKIRQNDQMEDQHFHPLDNTRLHPAIYVTHDWAVKIAFDALERDNVKARSTKALLDAMQDSQDDVRRLLGLTEQEWEARYGGTLDRCRKEWDPRVNVPVGEWRDKVGDLDLEAFAHAIEKKGHGRWHSHFEMLLWEFRLPFIDPRKPMEPLTGDSQRERLFNLITGETDQSMRPGKEVTGKIVANGDFGSRVKLEGDIPAFIPLRSLSDEHVESAEDIVAVGQLITAVVAQVKKDHMTVDLSLRMDDFRREPSSWDRPSSLPSFDAHFDYGAAARIDEDNKKQREAHIEALQVSLGRGSDQSGARKNRVVRRACTHPAFRNARNNEVDKEIREGGMAMVGQALIRPSSKQSDSLAIHWVVRDGSVKVIEVLEEDKETDAAIGNTLKIKEETYGSIDELLGRYVEPMNDFVDELKGHRKFVDLAEDELDDKLKAEKKANPAGIPYALCWMDMHPGYASLRFVLNTTPRNHAIGITPKGFSWGGRSFLTIDQLLNEFKKNPRGSSSTKKPAPPSQPPRPAPIPTIVPHARPPPPAVTPGATSRWGDRTTNETPAAPSWSHQPRPPPPPVPPQMPAATAGYGAPPALPMGTYGAPSRPAPPPRPPTGLPPAPTYAPPPNVPPPRPPAPPDYGQFNDQYNQQQPAPPRPPGPPPAFNAGPPPPAAGGSIGRGRGRTLPAWMAKQQQS